MRRFSVFIAFFACILTATAQDCTLKDYERLLQEAQKFSSRGLYDKAIDKLQSARVCRPEKETEVNQKIIKVFEQVNGERKKAEYRQRVSENIALLSILEPKDPTLALRVAEYNMKRHPQDSIFRQVYTRILNDPVHQFYRYVIAPEPNRKLRCFAVSEKNNRIVAAFDNKDLCEYDLTGLQLMGKTQTAARVGYIGFSSDETEMVLGDESGKITVVNLTEPKTMRSYPIHSGGVGEVIISDGNMLSFGHDSLVQVTELATGKSLFNLKIPDRIIDMDMAANNAWLGIVTKNKTTLMPLQPDRGPIEIPGSYNAVAFHPKDSVFVLSDVSGYLYFYNFALIRQMGELIPINNVKYNSEANLFDDLSDDYTRPVIRFTRDGRYLFATSGDKVVKYDAVFDNDENDDLSKGLNLFKNRDVLSSLSGHRSPVIDYAVLQSGKIATAAADGIRIWDTAPSHTAFSAVTPASSLAAVVSDGSVLRYCNFYDSLGTALLIKLHPDRQNREDTLRIYTSATGFQTFSIAKGGRYAIYSDSNGAFFAYNLRNFSSKKLEPVKDTITILKTRYLPGKQCLIAQAGLNVCGWSVATGKLLFNYAIKEGLSLDIDISEDENRMLIPTEKGLKIIDISNMSTNGHLPATLILQGTECYSAEFQHGNSNTVFACTDKGFIVCNVNGKMIQQIDPKPGERAYYIGIALSADNELVFLGGANSIRVLDIPSGKTLYKSNISGFITDIELSADEKYFFPAIGTVFNKEPFQFSLYYTPRELSEQAIYAPSIKELVASGMRLEPADFGLLAKVSRPLPPPPPSPLMNSTMFVSKGPAPAAVPTDQQVSKGTPGPQNAEAEDTDVNHKVYTVLSGRYGQRKSAEEKLETLKLAGFGAARIVKREGQYAVIAKDALNWDEMMQVKKQLRDLNQVAESRYNF